MPEPCLVLVLHKTFRWNEYKITLMVYPQIVPLEQSDNLRTLLEFSPTVSAAVGVFTNSNIKFIIEDNFTLYGNKKG
jgi:hypothetical protein